MGPIFDPQIPKHGSIFRQNHKNFGSIFWAKSLNMGTFFTSKHGLGSRGPGGTPPSKPKSSTPPPRIVRLTICENWNFWKNKCRTITVNPAKLKFQSELNVTVGVDTESPSQRIEILKSSGLTNLHNLGKSKLIVTDVGLTNLMESIAQQMQ